MLTKLDALIIAVLSLTGTGTMIEAKHRVVIGSAEVVSTETIALAPQPVALPEQSDPGSVPITYCPVMGFGGELIFSQYVAVATAAMAENATLTPCDEAR